MKMDKRRVDVWMERAMIVMCALGLGALTLLLSVVL